MEQRVIVAIILSVVVLVGYDSIFMRQKHQTNSVINSEVYSNKQVTNTTPTPLPSVKINTPNIPEQPAKITTITTPRLTIDFSDIGGDIQKIKVSSFNTALPVSNMVSLPGYDQKPFRLFQPNKDTIIYSYEDNFFNIKKIYSITSSYIINFRMEIINKLDVSRMENNKIQAFNIDASRMENSNHDNMLNEYSIYNHSKVNRKSNANKFSTKDNKNEDKQTVWLGYRDRYLCFIVKPEASAKGYSVEMVTENQLTMNFSYSNSNFKVGETIGRNFIIYAGPQDLAILKSYKQDFDKIMAFSDWPIIDIIAKAIYYANIFLHNIFRNWGISIILISLLLYGLTYPLTVKSMLSMRKMQELNPKVAALREKYKNDSKKMNIEVMELYKKNKVNPLGGCLPLLLQMPVFYCLYQVLWRAVQFKGAHFLWIKDLSEPDRIFILPFQLPFLGNEVNVLPILVAVLMFVQQKFSSKNIVVIDESQAMQQKMMTTIMPFFMGFIFYKFSSGFLLYMTMFYAMSTWTQIKMAKSAKSS